MLTKHVVKQISHYLVVNFNLERFPATFQFEKFNYNYTKAKVFKSGKKDINLFDCVKCLQLYGARTAIGMGKILCQKK